MRPALMVGSLALFVSCVSTIRPPAGVIDPSTVVLLVHGKSSSLVLGDQEGRAVRFAYGDWRYYALNRTGVFEAMAAVLWPTLSALGRQVMDSVADVGIPYDQALPIRVEREAVRRLREKLESQFLSRIETRVYNPEPKLEFVHHHEPYTLFNNSNTKVAQWLRELGAQVSGFPLLSRWRIEPPP